MAVVTRHSSVPAGFAADGHNPLRSTRCACSTSAFLFALQLASLTCRQLPVQASVSNCLSTFAFGLTSRCPRRVSAVVTQPRARSASGMNDGFVTTAKGARDDLVSDHCRVSARATLRRGPRRQHTEMTRYRLERLSLLTFFAAAKKVSAAPHRGNASAARR